MHTKINVQVQSSVPLTDLNVHLQRIMYTANKVKIHRVK